MVIIYPTLGIQSMNEASKYTYPENAITTCSLNDRIATEREVSKEREAARIEKEIRWKEEWQKQQKERFDKIKKEQSGSKKTAKE